MNFEIVLFLLQILMVLFPIILYLALTNGRIQHGKDNPIWGMVCALTIVLSMLFSIKLPGGILLDIRLVPWFLSFIYGGTPIGILVTLFTAFFRILLGGEGAGLSVALLSASAFIVYRINMNYHSWSLKKKISISTSFFMLLTMGYSFMGLLVLGEEFMDAVTKYFLAYILANVVIVWLIIHLKETFRLKQRLEKELHRKEKMEVVGQLAASVAHEIRNPMTSVRGFIQLMETAENITEDQRNYLNVCVVELDRANEIISDYLSLGKREGEEDELTKIDIGQEAIQSAKSLSSFATLNNVNLEYDISQPAIMLGTSGRSRQMFINLLKNGIEASQPGGTVRIRLVKKEDKAIFYISDEGEGLDPEQINKLGLPFYSTKEKGTGLGLMVTLQIIHDMGGSWYVKSKKNKGTTFKITFPLSE